MPITEITSKEQFDTILANSNYTLVDFYAQWCGPCKRIAPKLHEMSDNYTEVVFLKVDIDAVPDLKTAHDIKAMPTFMLFSKGDSKPKTTVVGADPMKIEYAIKMLLGKDVPQDDF